MKNSFTRISSTPTGAYIAMGIALFAASCLIEVINNYLFVSHGIQTPGAEFISSIFGWVGFVGLLLLLPVSAFRPFSEFSLRGNCRQRARLFGITLAANIVILSLGVWMIAKAFLDTNKKQNKAEEPTPNPPSG